MLGTCNYIFMGNCDFMRKMVGELLIRNCITWHMHADAELSQKRMFYSILCFATLII